jgi:hypothetical protein
VAHSCRHGHMRLQARWHRVAGLAQVVGPAGRVAPPLAIPAAPAVWVAQLDEALALDLGQREHAVGVRHVEALGAPWYAVSAPYMHHECTVQAS